MVILRGDLLYVLPYVVLFLCFAVLLSLRLPRLGKRELILVFFVRLFDLRLFCFICYLFLLVSGKGCGWWLWHSMDFLLPPFFPVFCPVCWFIGMWWVMSSTVITKTSLFKYTETFTTKKWKFSDKNSDIFHINIKHRLGVLREAVLTSTHKLCFSAEIRKIMYTPVNPNFTI